MKFQCFLESIRKLLDYSLDTRRVILEVGEHPGWNSAAVLTHWVFNILTPKMSKNEEIRGKILDNSLFDEKIKNVERNSVIILVLTTSKTEISRFFAKIR